MQQTQSPRHNLQIDLNQEQSHYSENRLAGRYPTFCTVELDSGTGFTRDLSTLGVCFTTDSEIRPDSMLRCFILMQKKGKNMARMRCEGRVVRANKFADGWEVAIHFTSLEW
jgi:hypothetical protein